MKALIKKETISKIEEEINQKITLPSNLKEKVKKDVFTNIAIAILMILYFTFLIMGSVETVKSVRSVDFNIFSILLLGVTIYLFETAYKKDNGTLAIYGVEALVVSIITLFFPYIIFELDEFSKKYYMIVSAYIAVYYIIKSIWIVGKAKKIHIKQSSDIKEIVKKEKRKDVIRVKEKTVIEEKRVLPKKRGSHPKNVGKMPLGDPQTKQIKKLEKVNDDNKPKEEVILKKRGRPKKSEAINNENKNNADTVTQSEQKPKKRGRPKKSETTNNANKNHVGVGAHIDPQTYNEQKPKKRGRPRKVVTADD